MMSGRDHGFHASLARELTWWWSDRPCSGVAV